MIQLRMKKQQGEMLHLYMIQIIQVLCFVSPTNAGKYKSLSLITGTATEYPAGINAGLSNVKLSISNTAEYPVLDRFNMGSRN